MFPGCRPRVQLEGTAAAAPPPFRPGNPAVCGSCPLVTPYYCRLGDLLCFVFMSAYCLFDLFVYYLFLQYFDTVGRVFWPVKTVSHITYTHTVLSGDVKHCSIQSNPGYNFCRGASWLSAVVPVYGWDTCTEWRVYPSVLLNWLDLIHPASPMHRATRWRHVCLSWADASTSTQVNPILWRSLFTTSLQFVLGLPGLLLNPTTSHWRACTVMMHINWWDYLIVAADVLNLTLDRWCLINLPIHVICCQCH